MKKKIVLCDNDVMVQTAELRGIECVIIETTLKIDVCLSATHMVCVTINDLKRVVSEFEGI